MAATPVTTVTNELTTLDADMLTVAAAGIGVGATLFAVRKGWRFVKGLI